jgi:dCMP deaminase
MKHEKLYKAIVTTLSECSKADRARVSCIILKDDRIICTGYNGQLPGQPHEKIMQDGHDISTLHAEQNALME